MNKYLDKIAKEDGKGSWVVPAAVSSVPVIAMGASRHGELDIRDVFRPEDRAMNAALRSKNIKTTATLAGLTMAAAGIGEAARRNFFSHQKEEQTKDIKKVVQQEIKKVASHQVEVKGPNKHNWTPAIAGGIADIPAGIATAWAGGKLAQKLRVNSHLGVGLVSGALTAGTLDYMQRKEERKLREKQAFVRHIPGVGKHNEKPDSDFRKKELSMGRKVEHEHTDSYQAAEDVAKDHLSEMPNYYTELKKMEEKGKKNKYLKKAAEWLGTIQS